MKESCVFCFLSRISFNPTSHLNWPNFILWLLLLIEILGNMCITIACEPGCDVTKFEIIFLIKPFCYMTKKSRQKFKYLENKKSFWGEIKSLFHHFYRALSCQKLYLTWVCIFNWDNLNIFLIRFEQLRENSGSLKTINTLIWII